MWNPRFLALFATAAALAAFEPHPVAAQWRAVPIIDRVPYAGSRIEAASVSDQEYVSCAGPNCSMYVRLPKQLWSYRCHADLFLPYQSPFSNVACADESGVYVRAGAPKSWEGHIYVAGHASATHHRIEWAPSERDRNRW